jgi:polyisoprenyl-teichoic acid--peptidoglycan teichoic acid transferase
VSPDFNDLPRPGIWKKLLLGALLVIFATASATAVAAFHEVDRVVATLRVNRDIQLGKSDIATVDPGQPQTILLLGSDKRPKGDTDGSAGGGARSDTIILARLDPKRKATALMSLPRDLKVQIPGHGTDKINAAYEEGGPKLTLQTVKRLTGLSVNHVINVDFKGFYTAVNAIGCIYSDVDRRYFNDTAEFAYINVQPGYQKLCGREALQYARFRHEDSDLVRSARQQNLLRDAKQQVGAGELINDRDKLYRIFGKYTTSDIHSRAEVLRLAKLALFSVGQPISEVHFEGQITSGDEQTNTPSYVTASDRTVKKLTKQFLGVEDSKGPRGELLPKNRKKRRKPHGDGGLENAPAPGMDQAVQAVRAGAGGKLPVYYPTVRVKNSMFAGPPRVYKVKAPGGRAEKSYRMVFKRGLIGEYYGVQGTTWKDPPILADAHEDRTMGGRKFELHYDGDRLRLVAWHTRRATYWVANTLLQSLSERQMLAIARSTRPL